MTRAYKRWSKDEVLKVILELHDKGVPLNSGNIARRYPALAYAGRKYVGSWEAAVKTAGFDYEKIRRKSFWNQKKIVDRIRELNSAGEPLYVSAAERKHGGLVGAAAVYFGSWRAAVKAAGLDYSQIKRQREWNRARVAGEIRRMHREGMPLYSTIPVRERYRVLHAAAVRYFHSWQAAVKAAGLARYLKKH